MDAGGAEVTRRLGGWAVRGLPLAFLLLMLGVPAAALLAQAGTPDPLALWQDTHLRARLAWSLAQAVLTCALTLALGLPLAWVLARLEFPLRRTCLRLVMLPFVVPTLVAALGVLALLGPHGSVSGALGLDLDLDLDLEGSPALLLYGNVFFNLCLVVRAGVDGLQRSSASRVAAARSLGATPWRAFWRVEWPALQTTMWMLPVEPKVARADPIAKFSVDPTQFSNPTPEQLATQSAGWVKQWTRVVLK